MYLPVNYSAGSVGLMMDVDPTQLPSEGWSAGRNIRTLNGRLLKSTGPASLYSAAPIVPYGLFPIQIGNSIFWVTPGLTAAYMTDGVSWYEITRRNVATNNQWAASYTPALNYEIGDENGNIQKVTAVTGPTGISEPAPWATTSGNTTTDGGVTWTCEGTNILTGANPYSGTAGVRWNGDTLNGILVLNNGVDVPQAWQSPNTGTYLTDLPYWPKANRAGIIRAFQTFLIAMGGSVNGVATPYTVTWSSPADPGSVPTSWSAASPYSQAGDFPLGQTGGLIVDGCVLQSNFFIYKSDSVWALQFVGGNNMFALVPVFGDIGLLAQGCVTEVNRQHIMATQNDIVAHNGVSWQSIIDGKMKRWLFNQIDPAQVGVSFITRNTQRSEVWFCFAQVGQSYPQTALVYNWRDQSLVVIDIPNVTDGREFIIPPVTSNDTFGGVPLTLEYLNYNISFTNALTDDTNKQLVMVSPQTSFLYEMDALETNNGTPFYSYAERTGLDFGSPEMTKRLSPFFANLKQVPPINALLSIVYPQMRASDSVQVQVGAQARSLNDPVVWTAPVTYTPGVSVPPRFLVNGRYLAFRISSNTNVHWELDGYGVDFSQVGVY